MIEMLIARHGQSVGDIERRYEGRADLPLTDLGREQARKLAAWLAAYHTPDCILASSLKRAAETARIVGDRIGLQVRHCDALMELDSGLIAGMKYEEADAKYPKPKVPLMPHEPICVTGESQLEFRFRAEKFLSGFFLEYDGEYAHRRIMLVSHGAMIDMMLRCLLKLSIAQDISFQSYDTGLHLLKADRSRASVQFLNSTAHLL